MHASPAALQISIGTLISNELMYWVQGEPLLHIHLDSGKMPFGIGLERMSSLCTVSSKEILGEKAAVDWIGVLGLQRAALLL